MVSFYSILISDLLIRRIAYLVLVALENITAFPKRISVNQVIEQLRDHLSPASKIFFST